MLRVRSLGLYSFRDTYLYVHIYVHTRMCVCVYVNTNRLLTKAQGPDLFGP